MPADAEVREEGTGANLMRGDHNELATRRGTTQNSVMLMRFDISGITLGDLAANPYVGIRLHVNTNSWNPSRSNSVPAAPATGIQYGLEYHALNLGAPGQNWDEGTLSFATAPGLTIDSNVATKGYNSDTTLLGTRDFTPIHVSDELYLGYDWNFTNPNLTSFIQSAITANAQFVTFLVGVNVGQAGYNYVFASNDTTVLLTNASYDPDGSGPLPAGPSPNSASPNTGGRWSPKLILSDRPVPEPSTFVLLGLGGLAALKHVRRRK